MENIVTQTLEDIETLIRDHGDLVDSWLSDGIHKILVLAFNRSFQKGRSAGLNEVMRLLVPGGKGEYPLQP